MTETSDSAHVTSADGIVALGVVIAFISWAGVMGTFIAADTSLASESVKASRPTRLLLVYYIRGMFFLSTTAVLCNLLSLVQDINWGPGGDVFVGFSGVPNGSGIAGASCLLVVIWLSDGFLFWRCYMLYATTTPQRRRALLIGLTLLMFALLGLSLTYIVQLWRSSSSSSEADTAQERNRAATYFVSMTLGINIILTTLIVLRLTYHHRRIAKLFGRHHGKVYTRIISICLESASIVVLIDILCILFFVTPGGSGSAVPYECMIHFYVIAPLYIIHRVATGQATGTTNDLGDDPERSPAVDEVIARGRHHLTTLAFTHSVSVVVRESTETEYPDTITLVPLLHH